MNYSLTQIHKKQKKTKKKTLI